VIYPNIQETNTGGNMTSEENSADQVLTEVNDGIATVTMNRPKLLNSISIDSLDILIQKPCRTF